MLLFIVCFLYYRSFWLDTILLGLAIFSKEQNLVFALLLLAIFIKHKPSLAKIIASALVLGSILYVYGAINNYSIHMNSEDGVLSGLLHNTRAEEAQNILSSIGLDPNLYVLRDHDFWGNVAQIRNNPYDMNLQQQFHNAETITKFDTIYGYLNYPGRFFSNYWEYIKLNNISPFVDNYITSSDGSLASGYMAYFAKIVLSKVAGLLLINLILSLLLPIYLLKQKWQLNSNSKWHINHKNWAWLLWIFNFNLLLVIPINFMGAGYAEPVRHCVELIFCESINLILAIAFIGRLVNLMKNNK
jgi:hypothetical protein